MAHHCMLMSSVIRISFTAQEVLEGAFWERLGVGVISMGQCMCDGMVLSSHLHASPSSALAKMFVLYELMHQAVP